jgi:adenine phosphoribosyltransferase
MDQAEAARRLVRLVPGAGGKRHLMHPYNGRFHQVDYQALDALVEALARRVDPAAIDYVLGFPEGGSIPAYAFGRAIERPVVLASRLALDLPGRLTFEQPHAGLGTTQFVYGLGPGDRVIIVEDELTNGLTATNAVSALRGAGIEVREIATLFAIDHPALWRRMRAADVRLHVGVTLAPEYAPRPLDAGAG